MNFWLILSWIFSSLAILAIFRSFWLRFSPKPLPNWNSFHFNNSGEKLAFLKEQFLQFENGKKTEWLMEGFSQYFQESSSPSLLPELQQLVEKRLELLNSKNKAELPMLDDQLYDMEITLLDQIAPPELKDKDSIPEEKWIVENLKSLKRYYHPQTVANQLDAMFNLIPGNLIPQYQILQENWKKYQVTWDSCTTDESEQRDCQNIYLNWLEQLDALLEKLSPLIPGTAKDLIA